MAYNTKKSRATRDTRELIPGSGKLPPGQDHRVLVSHIQILDSQRFVVTFTDAYDNEHRESLFLYTQDGNNLSRLRAQLIAAAAKDSDEVKQCADDPEAMKNLVGRPVIIATKYRDNYVNLDKIKGVTDGSLNDGRSFFQSAPVNSSTQTNTDSSREQRRFIPVSQAAQSFFSSNT